MAKFSLLFLVVVLLIITSTDQHVFARSVGASYRATNQREMSPFLKAIRSQTTNISASLVQTVYWENGVVPSIIDESVSTSEDCLIEAAFKHIEMNSNVTFVPVSPWHQNYVRIINDETGCWSMVGMQGGAQKLSLGTGCYTFNTIVHELLHVLGFEHEHKRSDRDDHVQVNEENIIPDVLDQFDQNLPQDEIRHTAYDKASLLNYESHSGSANGKPTIESLSGNPLPEDWDKFGLSEGDKLGLYKVYGGVSKNYCRMYRLARGFARRCPAASAKYLDWDKVWSAERECCFKESTKFCRYIL